MPPASGPARSCIACGRARPTRATPELKLGLSQRDFASFIGTAVGTVRKWELGTRQPSGAARALIDVIKAEPSAVRRALGKR